LVDVEELYRKYGPMVLRRCRRLLGEEDAALDAMQETFVRLLRHREDLSDDAPSSLLYCMATNVCLNVIRSRKAPGRAAPAPGDEAILLGLASSEDVEALSVARILVEGIFHREAPSTRTMAVLHYVDGMSLEETAAATGLSVSGVRKRLAMLRKRSLEREGEEQ
jgi:RNA polymerase sigma-70 factor (ECF subfamily)